MNVLFVFRFRGDAVRFSAILRSSGIAATTLSTPPKYGKSCGLSVAVNAQCKDKAARLLTANGLAQSVVNIVSK